MYVLERTVIKMKIINLLFLFVLFCGVFTSVLGVNVDNLSVASFSIGPIIGALVFYLFGILAYKFGFEENWAQAQAASNVKEMNELSNCIDQVVTVRGNVSPEKPVSEPEAGVPECLWYNVSWEELIERTEIETHYDEEDDETEIEVEHRHEWRTTESESDETDFELETDAGSVWIDNSGAEVKGTKSIFKKISYDERITGSYLPLIDILTVLGRVTKDENGELMITKDSKTGLLITPQTPDQVASSEKTKAIVSIVIGGVLALIGTGFLLNGLGIL